MTPREFWGRAAQWGSYMRDGDPGACMYGFDEHGEVQSERHRAICVAWLNVECRKAAAVNEDPIADNKDIDELIEYLKTAPRAKPGWRGTGRRKKLLPSEQGEV